MKLRSFWYLIEGAALVSASASTLRVRYSDGGTSQQLSVMDDLVLTTDHGTIAVGGGSSLANRFVAVNTDESSVDVLYNGASSGTAVSAAKSAIISAIDAATASTTDGGGSASTTNEPATFKDALTSANLKRVLTDPTPNEVLAVGAGALVGLLLG